MQFLVDGKPIDVTLWEDWIENVKKILQEKGEDEIQLELKK